MLLDAELEICDNVDVSAAAGTEYSNTDFGNILNLGATDFGVETDLWVRCVVTTAFASGGSATVKFKLPTDTVAPIDGSSATLHDTGAIDVATLVAGYEVFMVPLNPLTAQAILGLAVITAVAATTAGSIDCYLVRRPEKRD